MGIFPVRIPMLSAVTFALATTVQNSYTVSLSASLKKCNPVVFAALKGYPNVK